MGRQSDPADGIVNPVGERTSARRKKRESTCLVRSGRFVRTIACNTNKLEKPMRRMFFSIPARRPRLHAPSPVASRACSRTFAGARRTESYDRRTTEHKQERTERKAA